MSEIEDLHRAMEIADKYGLRIASPWDRKFRNCKLCGKFFAYKKAQRGIKFCSEKCRRDHYYDQNRDRLREYLSKWRERKSTQ